MIKRKAIEKISKIFIGDEAGYYKYKSGYILVKFFNENFQIVDKTTKISMNILMFWSFFKKNKPYD